MSTLKSSAEDLTLNADGSGNDIKFQSNAVEKGSLTDGGVWIGSTFEPTGDTAASDNAAIGYTAAEGLILTGQGSTDDVTIKNDADTTVLNVATGSSDIEVSAGDLIFGTAGKGVCLGVTTNTDSNTLDDYEEGTWTPSVGGDATYNTQTGKYTKVGNMITLVLEMNINVLGTGSTTTISGAPFTPISGTHTASAPIGYAANLATNCIGLYFRMDAGNAQIHNATLNSAAATTSSGTAIFGNSARVLFSITYLTTT